jgi:hypothetical protein
MEKNENTFAEKVESILDELFADEDPDPGAVEENTPVGYYPLRFLKATVLSIDWEITDETMARFIDQVERLKSSHRDDKTLLPLLQMLGSIGQHIRIFKENSHPNALKILKSLYISLEKVMTSKQISEIEKSRILFREIRKFKTLKSQIVDGNLALSAHREPKPQRPAASSASPVKTQMEIDSKPQVLPVAELKASPEAWAAVVEELKQFIRDEFQALRKELNDHYHR